MKNVITAEEAQALMNNDNYGSFIQCMEDIEGIKKKIYAEIRHTSEVRKQNSINYMYHRKKRDVPPSDNILIGSTVMTVNKAKDMVREGKISDKDFVDIDEYTKRVLGL